MLTQTSASPAQADAAVQINEDARLRALRTSLLLLAGLALFAIIPAGSMPRQLAVDLPRGGLEESAALSREKTAPTT
ncbi:MAG: hypothetical protein M3024_16120 [Candidatus Dormibacteraeota bacterium]|nr:hypothetical protein [Candidatus Dormibacteraeota bacterium]